MTEAKPTFDLGLGFFLEVPEFTTTLTATDCCFHVHGTSSSHHLMYAQTTTLYVGHLNPHLRQLMALVP
ncbi:hypothetical protein PanWU01x14_045240 [Parasponia andersonii]|uniref:Uncharacterized protein n=1 Tax=Parasponia andersonii TaxID=3476 RepID=A0A2P5DPF7_PARAD|nr:hypothetical protein PanWU01x14_045240 [Parasponia andersonii]